MDWGMGGMGWGMTPMMVKGMKGGMGMGGMGMKGMGMPMKGMAMKGMGMKGMMEEWAQWPEWVAWAAWVIGSSVSARGNISDDSFLSQVLHGHHLKQVCAMLSLELYRLPISVLARVFSVTRCRTSRHQLCA